MADIRINSLPSTATSSSSDDFIAIDGSANGTRKLSAYSPTFGGNLTVSGTGTSSFANGALVKIGLPTNAPNTNLGGNLLQVKSAGGLAYITIGNGDVANATSYIGGASSYLLFGKVSDAGSLTEFARFVDSGNLLLGTTSDGGQKLQVAGTGIVKGSFYSARSDNTGSIQLIPTSGVSAGSDIESFNGSSSIYARLNMRTETFQIFTGSSGNTLCATFSGFDNSATFAGTISTATNAAKNAIVARYNSSNSLFGVTVNSSGQSVLSENTDASTGSDAYSKTGLPAFRLGNTGGSGTVPFWIDVAASGTAGGAITWTNAFKIDSSQNATFANGLVAGKAGSINTITGGDGGAGTSIIQFKDAGGTTKVNIIGTGVMVLSSALRLGNAYTAGAVVTTGYVTIQDSSGTTYKIPVGT